MRRSESLLLYERGGVQYPQMRNISFLYLLEFYTIEGHADRLCIILVAQNKMKGKYWHWSFSISVDIYLHRKMIHVFEETNKQLLNDHESRITF